MMESMFISRPTQINSQWELNVAMAVPVTRVKVIMARTIGLISTGRM